MQDYVVTARCTKHGLYTARVHARNAAHAWERAVSKLNDCDPDSGEVHPIRNDLPAPNCGI